MISRTQRGYARLAVWTAVAAAALAAPASAVTVRFDPPAVVHAVGDVFTVKLVADFGGQSIIGWGLDLSFDDLVAALDAPPAIGPYWQAAFAPDGDGLAGSADPFSDPDNNGLNGSIGGSNILLATLTFSGVAVGQTSLVASATPGDLNEGFALDPAGFAGVVYQPGTITIVPEPAMVTLALLPVGLIRRRRR